MNLIEPLAQIGAILLTFLLFAVCGGLLHNKKEEPE